MILKLFVVLIYCFLIKFIFQMSVLVIKMFKKSGTNKARMHRFHCPYCRRYNELLATVKPIFFFSKFTPIFFSLGILSIITALIPLKYLTSIEILSFIRKVLLYIVPSYGFIGLLFGGVALLANMKLKIKNVDPNKGIIFYISRRIFNIRKAQCSYCKKESYKITGY